MKWRSKTHAYENALRWFVQLPKSSGILDCDTGIDGFQKNSNRQKKLIRRGFLEKGANGNINKIHRICHLRMEGVSGPLAICKGIWELWEPQCLWGMHCPFIDIHVYTHAHAFLWLQRWGASSASPLSSRASFSTFMLSLWRQQFCRSQELAPRTVPARQGPHF